MAMPIHSLPPHNSPTRSGPFWRVWGLCCISPRRRIVGTRKSIPSPLHRRWDGRSGYTVNYLSTHGRLPAASASLMCSKLAPLQEI